MKKSRHHTPAEQFEESHPSGDTAGPTLRDMLLCTAAPLSDALSEWENDYRATEADPSLTADQRIALWMDQDDSLTKRVRTVPVRSLADAVAAAGQYLKLARGDVTAHAVPEAVDLALAEGLHAYLSELRATVQATEGNSTIIPSLGMTFRQAADRVQEMLNRCDARKGIDDPEDAEALAAVEAERDRECREWIRLHDAVLITPARTVGDLFAKLKRITCPFIGATKFEMSDDEYGILADDVRRLGGAAMLSVRPETPARHESTLISSIGMTFTQAAGRIAANHAEHLALPDEDEESAARLVDEGHVRQGGGNWEVVRSVVDQAAFAAGRAVMAGSLAGAMPLMVSSVR